MTRDIRSAHRDLLCLRCERWKGKWAYYAVQYNHELGKRYVKTLAMYYCLVLFESPSLMSCTFSDGLNKPRFW